ncbi:MAG: phosphoenolpyruvate--protein phosphotransferase [Chlamydiae bacterium RIFCSPHIGHO2_12_FULL_49_11]|nr:MAG: phosphoenolpyruvate--protein phosphotransferase [Chlamydiae bacterium RIFCSPHIGHO2_12_FULL_49_11]
MKESGRGNLLEQKQGEFIGIGISEGVAVGKLVFVSPQDVGTTVDISITPQEAPREIHRFRKALIESKLDLEKLEVDLGEKGSLEALQVIRAHIQLLEDPMLVGAVETKIPTDLKNAETVLSAVVVGFKQFFEMGSDPMGREKFLDLQDVTGRILSHLVTQQNGTLKQLPKGAILCSYELAPSFTAEAIFAGAAGFITEVGSETSHSGLIAKSQGIPYVSHINVDLLTDFEDSTVIVDAFAGKIIVAPDEKVTAQYGTLRLRHQNTYATLMKNLPEHVVTKDNVEIRVSVNVETLGDVDKMHEFHAHGIGLLRSEFLYYRRDFARFDEEEQVELYSTLLEKAAGKEVVFRLFDLGGDKRFGGGKEGFSMRSLRILLAHPEILLSQLRAIFRASVRGNVKLLLPFVTTFEEFEEIKSYIDLVKEELGMDTLPPLGCMIEVPSMVMTLSDFLPHCDFFSVGTNDLMQFCLALDRSSVDMVKKYGLAHPALLRMLKQIVDTIKPTGKSLTVCGEIASNRFFLPVLVGMGITSLSCSTRSVPYIKEALLHLSTKVAHKQALECLLAKTSHEVVAILSNR